MRVFILGAGATGGLLAQLLRRRGHTVWCGEGAGRNPSRHGPARVWIQERDDPAGGEG